MSKHAMTAREITLALKLMKDALREYARPKNWDGCGGWIHPSYSTEFAEMALEAVDNLEHGRKPLLIAHGRRKGPVSLSEA